MGERLTGVVPGLPEDDYRSYPAFSASEAKVILDSPARYEWEYLKGNRVEKSAFDVGSAVHAKVLGVGHDVAVLDFDNYRTKAAQDARKEARDAGRIPMLAHEMAPVDAMAEAVLAHGMARRLLEIPGQPEVSVFADADGLPVKCRFDYLPDAGPITVDLKTTAGSASPAGFAKAAADHLYHVQRGHYLDVLERATGRVAEMVFIVVEKQAPYLVGVHQIDREFADMGEVEMRAARDLYRRCLESGVWPGYPETINLVQPPVYAIYQHQDKFGENQ